MKLIAAFQLDSRDGGAEPWEMVGEKAVPGFNEWTPGPQLK